MLLDNTAASRMHLERYERSVTLGPMQTAAFENHPNNVSPKSLTLPPPTMNQEITPMDLHHPILREFPEHRDAIKRLKGSDDHFRHVFDEYHRLDDEIYRIEEEIDFATDQEIEEMKMRRAKLKDYIYHLIRHAPSPCPTCAGTGVAS